MFVIYLFKEVDAEDERALSMFMTKEPQARRTLADIIMEKITEKQTEIRTQMSGRPFDNNCQKIDTILTGIKGKFNISVLSIFNK